MGRPVVISMSWKAGRIVAVSGSNLLTNPANSHTLANANTVEQLFQWLSSRQVADQSVDAKRMAKTFPTRIDPDQVIEAGGFCFLYPDPLPKERLSFLREKTPIVYSRVSELFGYEAKEQKTLIALMSPGGGWTAGPKLIGIGVLGDEVVVVSVLCHEFSNSLCSDAGDMPVWLGDAGWSAMVQVKVKTALGGKFAESVKGQVQRQIGDYHKWESAHGLYDISSGYDVGRGGDPTLADTVGEGKVMAIISDFEKRYGADVMKRFFAAMRRWKDDSAVRAHPVADRIVFYFSVATGEDQYAYFKKLGTKVERIPLPEGQGQATGQMGSESGRDSGVKP